MDTKLSIGIAYFTINSLVMTAAMASSIINIDNLLNTLLTNILVYLSYLFLNVDFLFFTAYVFVCDFYAIVVHCPESLLVRRAVIPIS